MYFFLFVIDFFAKQKMSHVNWKPALRETLGDEGELMFEQQNGINV